MKILSIAILLFLSNSINAQQIKNFTVKEDQTQKDKIAITATDSLEKPVTINGTYNFTINGFKQELRFRDGIAVSPLNIEESSFVYIKHENEEKSTSKMFYIVKSPLGLSLFSISWYILLAIPIGLILLGYMFRKLIGIAIFLLMAYIYFNYSKGLSISTFLESMFDGLKNLF